MACKCSIRHGGVVDAEGDDCGVALDLGDDGLGVGKCARPGGPSINDFRIERGGAGQKRRLYYILLIDKQDVYLSVTVTKPKGEELTSLRIADFIYGCSSLASASAGARSRPTARSSSAWRRSCSVGKLTM